LILSGTDTTQSNMVDSFSAANARDAFGTYVSTGERALTTLSRRFCCR